MSAMSGFTASMKMSPLVHPLTCATEMRMHVPTHRINLWSNSPARTEETKPSRSSGSAADEPGGWAILLLLLARLHILRGPLMMQHLKRGEQHGHGDPQLGVCSGGGATARDGAGEDRGRGWCPAAGVGRWMILRPPAGAPSCSVRAEDATRGEESAAERERASAAGLNPPSRTRKAQQPDVPDMNVRLMNASWHGRSNEL